MELSVIIVSYNRRELLEQCLTSLQKELAGISSEIIVVDNASRENIAEMVRNVFPGIRLIQNRQNVGFARANNQGLESACGHRFLVLNPDTVVQPGAIVSLLRYLDVHPGVGAVGPRLIYGNGSFQPSTFGYPSILKEIANLAGIDRYFPKGGRIGALIGITLGRLFPEFFSMYLGGEEPRKVPSIFGACIMIRREVWEIAGGFDPVFFLYWEDAEWCYRMAKCGFEVHFFPGAVVTHQGGDDYYQPRKEGFFWYYQSLLLFYARHYSRIRIIGLRSAVLTMLVGRMFANRVEKMFTGRGEELDQEMQMYGKVIRWYRDFSRADFPGISGTGKENAG